MTKRQSHFLQIFGPRVQVVPEIQRAKARISWFDRFQKDFGFMPDLLIGEAIGPAAEYTDPERLLRGEVIEYLEDYISSQVAIYGLPSRFKKEFFTPTGLSPLLIEFHGVPVANPRYDAIRAHLTSWVRSGGDHGESWLEVGVTQISAHVYLKPLHLVVIGWTRDLDKFPPNWIRLAAEVFGRSIFQGLHDFGAALIRDREPEPSTIDGLAKSIVAFIKDEVSMLQNIFLSDESGKILHFQNPRWEKFLHRRGSHAKLDSLLRINQHAKSGEWMQQKPQPPTSPVYRVCDDMESILITADKIEIRRDLPQSKNTMLKFHGRLMDRYGLSVEPVISSIEYTPGIFPINFKKPEDKRRLRSTVRRMHRSLEQNARSKILSSTDKRGLIDNSFVQIAPAMKGDPEKWIAAQMMLAHQKFDTDNAAVSWLEVTPSICCLLVVLEPPTLFLAWWEREEKLVAPYSEIENAANQLCDTLFPALSEMFSEGWWSQQGRSRHGLPALAGLSDILVHFFQIAGEWRERVLDAADDVSVHHHQDPAWEEYRYLMGDFAGSEEIISKNRHPLSTRWRRPL